MNTVLMKKKTTTGSDTSRGLYANAYNLYLGLSTDSSEFRAFSSQTSFLSKYDLSLGGNDCVTLDATTDIAFASDTSYSTSTLVTSSSTG